MTLPETRQNHVMCRSTNWHSLMHFQLVLSTLSMILDPPEALERMPVSTDRLVELYCNLPIRALSIPLSFQHSALISVSPEYTEYDTGPSWGPREDAGPHRETSGVVLPPSHQGPQHSALIQPTTCYTMCWAWVPYKVRCLKFY